MKTQTDKEYYERQILGLIMIMEDNAESSSTIHRNYVVEKLKMMLAGGIGFHQSIKDRLE